MNRLIQLISVIAMLASSVAAQTDTTFTYQGSLSEAGEPANGSYNVDFTLFDAPSGGSQIGSTIQFNDLSVTDGFITVELDFGSSVYDGNQRWLEITVNGNELDPRQPITGSPYSIQTRGIFVDDVGNVGIGTTNPIWELEVANLTAGDGAESAVTADDASGAIAAYSSTVPAPFEHFAGRVSLLSNSVTMGLDLRADSLAGDMRFYTGGLWPSNERMRITGSGNVGIGTMNPLSRLSVGGDGEVIAAIYGAADDEDPEGQGGYFVAAGDMGCGVAGRASSTADSPKCGGAFVGSGRQGVGVYGGAHATTGVNYGVYGVSNALASGYDVFAGGMGIDYGSPSSIRWKSNIVEIDDALEKVAELRGVYFDWDEGHGGYRDVGMIAEEVGAVLPEIVVYEENGSDANGMDYSRLAPLLVEAVNALRDEKDAEIAELKRRISDLKQLLEQLAVQEAE